MLTAGIWRGAFEIASVDDLLVSLARCRFLIGIALGAEVGQSSPIPWPGGFDPAGLTVARGAWGKPYFVERPELHFNVSHTFGAIVAGLCSRPIGVDVERVGRYDPRVVARVFSAAERAYVREHETLVEHRFCEVWTRREARAKCSGEGGRAIARGPDVLDDARFTTASMGEHVVSVYY